MNNNAKLARDVSWSNNVINYIKDKFKLSDDLILNEIEDDTNKVVYDLNSSDLFSTLFSLFNKDVDFSYVDNESLNSSDSLSFVFVNNDVNSKMTLDGDLNNNVFKLIVTNENANPDELTDSNEDELSNLLSDEESDSQNNEEDNQ